MHQNQGLPSTRECTTSRLTLHPTKLQGIIASQHYTIRCSFLQTEEITFHLTFKTFCRINLRRTPSTSISILHSFWSLMATIPVGAIAICLYKKFGCCRRPLGRPPITADLELPAIEMHDLKLHVATPTSSPQLTVAKTASFVDAVLQGNPV